MTLVGENRRWVAHVCTNSECNHVEIHGSCNHALYMCYAHEPPVPLRPVVLGIVSVGDADWAHETRDIASNDGWRRPSQHFEPYPDTPDKEYLTEALPGEDWPGWPGWDLALFPTLDRPTPSGHQEESPGRVPSPGPRPAGSSGSSQKGQQASPLPRGIAWASYRCAICGHSGSPCPQHDQGGQAT